MDQIFKEIRYAVRLLVKNPGFTAISVLALSVGIGLVAGQFSIVKGILYQGLPFPESENIYSISRENVEREFYDNDVPLHELLEYEQQQTCFEGLSGYYVGTVNVTYEGQPLRYSGAFISANFLDILKQPTLYGRGFIEGEDRKGSPRVMLLGYGVWQRDFAGDPNVIGQSVRVNGEIGTIVGVMPEGFQFPFNEDVWCPVQIDLEDSREGKYPSLELFGRLKKDRNLEEAQTEMDAIMARLAEENPETNAGYTAADIKPYLEEFTGKEMRNMLYVMLVAVGGVLMIACANVANLQFARASLRLKEFAIRSALGASRGRIIRQMIIESMVLAFLGAIFGLILATWGIQALTNYMDAENPPPFWFNFSLDYMVVGFVVVITLVAGLLSGLVPAWRASKATVNDVLKEGGRGQSNIRLGWISKTLVVIQVAVSFALLINTGLMIKMIIDIKSVDIGFNPEPILTARIGLFEEDYPEEIDRVNFFTNLATNLGNNPSVESAATTNRMRFWNSYGTGLMVSGETYEKREDIPFAHWEAVTKDYFNTLGVSILEGRDFTMGDSEESLKVAIINSKLAQKFWPGESALGKQIKFGDFEQEEQEDWITVIGVVRDLRMNGVVDDERDEGIGFYVPLSQRPSRFMTLLAKSKLGDPHKLQAIMKEEVLKLDSNIPLYWVHTHEENVAANLKQFNLVSFLFTLFGISAVVLATIGVYGVMSFSVNQRTQEFGIRMALGANGLDILKLVIRQGVYQILIGLILGLGIAILLAWGVDANFPGFESNHPPIFIMIALILTAVALTACYMPARRATRIHPIVALRYE